MVTWVFYLEKPCYLHYYYLLELQRFIQSHVYVNPLTLHSQDLTSNSPNCFLYNPYDVSLEKSVMDQ